MLNSEILKTLECASSSSAFKHIACTPIALSCGHVICKECINDNYEIICIHCKKINFNELRKSNESLSTKSLFNIFLGQLFTHIEECFKEVLVINESKENNREDKVLDKIDQVMHAIESRVNTLKNELEELRSDLIRRVNKIKQDFSNLNENESKKFNKQRRIEEILDELNGNNNKRSESNFFEYQKELREMKESNKISRASPDLSLNFELSNFKFDLSFIGKLEYFNSRLQEVESNILSNVELNNLNELCDFSSISKWTLLYRGSLNGFSANDFHTYCDGKSNTLSIIETSNSNIFGGYVGQTWGNVGGYKNDSTAFVFSFKNKDNKPIKFNVLKAENAIYCRRDNGPIFGCNDFYIGDNCNKEPTSGSCFPIAFKTSNIKRDDNYLAGSKNFLVKEIEVYQIEN